MANRDLLKEAIADAKALKETAIANAKAALEEAFEPRLKSMLSAKLEEMEKEEELEEAEMTEAKKEVEEARAEDKETKRTEKMKYGKDLAEGDDEMDLDEILAELEEGEDKEEMEEALGTINDPDTETAHGNVAEAEEEEDEVEVDVEDEEVEGEDEDEEIDLDEMTEDDLKSFIEDVIADMVEAGELEAGEEFEAEDEESDEEEIDIDVEDDTEEIMEGEKEEVEEGIMDKLKKAYTDKELLSKIITVDGEKVSIKDLLSLAGSGAVAGQAKSGSGKTSSIGEAEVEDMMEEVNALRAELHEVNLLNAKLLYTNKIFRAKNLKEAQKVKVLEAFDKAETVKEVKLVFETMSENLATANKTIVKENLGSASKAAGVAPQRKANIVDVDPQVARWQKLAGLR